MTTRRRFRFFAGPLLMGASLIALSCSVNSTGLGGGEDAGHGSAVDGALGTGGRIGGSGGAPGTGGAPISGTGGATPGTGGEVGTGGTAGDPATGSGGQPSGSGGAEPPPGGSGGGGGSVDTATGGVRGTGGGVGTGGVGTGGTAMPGIGGVTGACNASSCPTGCCTTDGHCVTTETNARCGTRGAACAVCGACFTCSAGACALVPTSRWDLICVSASIAASRPNGQAWDRPGMGEPDPVCRSTLNGMTQTHTDVITNTLSPVWNGDITPTALPSTSPIGPGTGGLTTRITAAALMNNMGPSRWGVAVVDDDGSAFVNDPVCAVTPALTAASFAAGTVTFPPAGSCLKLTVRLQCAE